MVSISVLFMSGVFEHYFGMQSFGMNTEIVNQILAGEEEDIFGLVWKYHGMMWSFLIGVIMLWIAGILTLITGWDYFRKSLPHLRERDQK
jgi:cardiolipin synthase